MLKPAPTPEEFTPLRCRYCSWIQQEDDRFIRSETSADGIWLRWYCLRCGVVLSEYFLSREELRRLRGEAQALASAQPQAKERAS